MTASVLVRSLPTVAITVKIRVAQPSDAYEANGDSVLRQSPIQIGT